jgi:hypothetical protein
MSLLRVRCAKCERPVDRIEQWETEADYRLEIRVFCHGDRETMSLSLYDVEDAEVVKQIKGQEGVAFATARLTALATSKDTP